MKNYGFYYFFQKDDMIAESFLKRFYFVGFIVTAAVLAFYFNKQGNFINNN